MTGNIYTIGVLDPDAGHRLDMLLGGEIETPLKAILLDLRLVPLCALDPQWSGEGLRNRWGRKYHQLGMYLGNRNYENGGPFKFRDAPNGIRQIVGYLERGTDVVLLCSCADEAACHRVLVAQMAQVAMLEVPA